MNCWFLKGLGQTSEVELEHSLVGLLWLHFGQTPEKEAVGDELWLSLPLCLLRWQAAQSSIMSGASALGHCPHEFPVGTGDSWILGSVSALVKNRDWRPV